jgi:hypothetical protein
MIKGAAVEIDRTGAVHGARSQQVAVRPSFTIEAEPAFSALPLVEQSTFSDGSVLPAHMPVMSSQQVPASAPEVVLALELNICVVALQLSKFPDESVLPVHMPVMSSQHVATSVLEVVLAPTIKVCVLAPQSTSVDVS